MSEQTEVAVPEGAVTSRLLRLAFTFMPTLLVAVVVFVVAYDNGGAGESTRDELAIVLWWILILGVGLGIWPLRRIPRAALVAGGLLAAFGLFTLASTGWAADAAGAYSEFTRVALYVGVFALVVVSGGHRSAGRWSDGLALGIVAIVGVALVSRLFPGVFPNSTQEIARFLQGGETRLSFPLGYWNGLAIFSALGIPLLLRQAVSARLLPVRALAVAPIPAIAAVIYLASSRGGVLVAAIGAVVFIALVPGRWAAVGATAVAAVASAGVVLFLHARNTLVNGPLDSSVAHSQGRSAALIIVGICVLAGIAYWGACRLAPRAPQPSRTVGRILVGLVVVVVIAGIAASHPIRRAHDFTSPTTGNFEPGSAVQQHLLSGSGSGRWQLWQAAWKEFENQPLRGRGAGSYEAWWAQHGSIASFVQDAHSLYLQVLGELGIVGFLLLAGALGAALVAGVRRLLRAEGGQRTTLAALVAAFAAWAVAAGIDWMWELTAVSVVAVVCMGIMTGPATTLTDAPRLVDDAEQPPRRSRFNRFGIVVTSIVAGWLVICAIAIQLLAGVKLRDSQAAARQGDTRGAVNDALSARSIQPWSAEPYLQLALVYQDAGTLKAAQAWIGRAIAHDAQDWRLWLVQAQIQTGLELVPAAKISIERARELNPHYSLFQKS